MVDQMVQNAQEWLNAEYASHVMGGTQGYQPIPPDLYGKTGWTTMFALTRALQIELGIADTDLSDGFGPTTKSKFDVQVGVIKAGTKTNIVKILQSALYCKGYDGQAISGAFTAATQASVAQIASDMGLNPEDRKPNSRVMKALLTMDAYVVVTGGIEPIRSVEQWLNRTYPQFDIMPADGLYSRNVQKWLVWAIQLARNIAGANGNYGPGTRAAMQQSAAVVQQGSSGRLTQLFAAAMILNGYAVTFSDTFTSAITNAVRSMQSREGLPVTGKGDYATWSALLVSNGDPDRAVTGVDTRFWITTPIATDLYSNGYRFVGRYLTNVPGGTLDKKLRPGEAQLIINAGLGLFPIFQADGGQSTDFGTQNGVLHADAAVSAAEGFGIPHGAIIYFAVDFDPIDAVINSNVLPYFQALIGRMRSKHSPYLVGVYGTRNVCARISTEAGAVSSFVSGMSTGFSGNLGFPIPKNWAFNQIKETPLNLNGATYTQGGEQVAVDNDAVSGRDPGVRSLTSTSPNAWYMTYVDKIKVNADAWVTAHPTDSFTSNQLTLQYLRHWAYGGAYGDYGAIKWTVMAGGVNQSFIDYCTQQLSLDDPSVRYYDPVLGASVEGQHFAATADAVRKQGVLSDHKRVNFGDVGGWLGDIFTTYQDYTNAGGTDSDSSRMYDFFRARIGGLQGTFPLEDLIGDIDGYNIGINALSGDEPTSRQRRRTTPLRDFMTAGLMDLTLC